MHYRTDPPAGVPAPVTPAPGPPAPPDPLREILTAALGAQYEILRLIGRGGMGAVYLGRERLLERPVAIKVLPHDSGDEGNARERFLREARTAAQLTHPNIVPLYSFGEAGRTLFYVMAYVEGESLEQRLRREQRLSFDETRRILAEVASALDHAHSHGVVHRDIKPDNVLIEARTGRCVLTDFGIARHRLGGQTITSTGMIVGTPQYMSPEQASGERELDGRSDLFALGIMGYRMIAGRLPFAGSSVQELIAQIVSREPLPLSAVAPEVPPDLEAAVTRCLAKNPDQRWRSAHMLRDALQSDDVEQSLPDALEKVPSSSAVSVILGYPFILACTIAYAAGYPRWIGMVTWILAGEALGVIGTVWRLRRHGFSTRRSVRIAFWQPSWWDLWWPRPLRRPGDVWDRLPAEVRRVRGMISAAVLGTVGVILPALLHLVPSLAADGGSTPARWLAGILAIGGLGIAGVTIAVNLRYTFRWQKKYGLSFADAEKLRSKSTWKSRFWKRPEIAALLDGHRPTGYPVSAPESPEAIVAAILELAGRATSSPFKELMTEGVAAARDCLKAVALMDDELRHVARDADPAERARLEERIRSMGPKEGEAAGSRQMRQLLSGQLALIAELERRAEELAARRARAVELLRLLWLQLSALSANEAADRMELAEVSGRIRDICHHVAAVSASNGGMDAALYGPTSTTGADRG